MAKTLVRIVRRWRIELFRRRARKFILNIPIIRSPFFFYFFSYSFASLICLQPDTVPQGSVDMSKVLEVTGAEQVTGHPHSLALTSPDRVTFVKAASREDARWWAELLAVFPRRHKRNATFPGGRASPSLPQLGRSASPQPQRPRHLSCNGPSPRTNFTTPPLKEEKEQSPKGEENADGNCVETIVSTTSSIASASISSKVVSTATSPSTITARPTWFPKPTNTVPIESTPRTGKYHNL